MKIKTNELTAAALDWAVAMCEGFTNLRVGVFSGVLIMDPPRVQYGAVEFSGLCYSTDWAQGGPIIEREQISIRQWTNVSIIHAYMPQYDAPWASDGTSPLTAAMRCYAASKLGDTVEVPDALL